MVSIKGQATLLAVIAVIFVGGVGFFGIVASNEPIQETVEYNTGDYNQIAAAKLKSDAYENRTQREFNYSTTIKAIDLGENGGDDGDGDMARPDYLPTYPELRTEYLNAVGDHLQEQSDVIRCQSPRINEVNVYSAPSGFQAQLDNAWIKCSSPPSNGFIASEAFVNVSDTIRVDNPNNRYLILAEYSELLGEEAEDVVDNVSNSDWTSSGTGDDCGSSSDAIDDAESDAKSGLATPNAASEAWNNVNPPNWFQSIDISTSYDEEITSSSSSSVGDCGPSLEKTDYEADADAETNSVTVSFEYRDNRTVLDADGSRDNHVVFDFEYEIDVP